MISSLSTRDNDKCFITLYLSFFCVHLVPPLLAVAIFGASKLLVMVYIYNFLKINVDR